VSFGGNGVVPSVTTLKRALPEGGAGYCFIKSKKFKRGKLQPIKKSSGEEEGAR